MSEHKTFAIVKLNRGAWEATREELIQKFKAEGTLDTYSDDMVRTKDATYLVKIVTIDPYLLDPILGFEGRCDVTDLKRFLDKQLEHLNPYLPTEVSTTPDLSKETGIVSTPPPAGQVEVGPSKDSPLHSLTDELSMLVASEDLTDEDLRDASEGLLPSLCDELHNAGYGKVEEEELPLPTFSGKKVENEAKEPAPEGQQSENLAPGAGDTAKTDPNPVPGAEVKE